MEYCCSAHTPMKCCRLEAEREYLYSIDLNQHDCWYHEGDLDFKKSSCDAARLARGLLTEGKVWLPSRRRWFIREANLYRVQHEAEDKMWAYSWNLVTNTILIDIGSASHQSLKYAEEYRRCWAWGVPQCGCQHGYNIFQYSVLHGGSRWLEQYHRGFQIYTPQPGCCSTLPTTKATVLCDGCCYQRRDDERVHTSLGWICEGHRGEADSGHQHMSSNEINIGVANVWKLQEEPPVDGDWRAEITRRLKAKYGVWEQQHILSRE